MSYEIKSSIEIDKLAEALCSAQMEFKPILKTSLNPHFNKKYADLSAIIEATREALSKYGLAVMQFPMISEGRVIVVTRLLHKCGQWIEGALSLKVGADTPQGAGSAITYGRRYGMAALLNVSAEDDDDGNAAQPDSKGNQKQHNSAPNKGRDLQQSTELVVSIKKMLAWFEKSYQVAPPQLERAMGKILGAWGHKDLDRCKELAEKIKNGEIELRQVFPPIEGAQNDQVPF